jgi:hypothetical protein
MSTWNVCTVLYFSKSSGDSLKWSDMSASTLLNLNDKSQNSMQVQITFEYVKSEIREMVEEEQFRMSANHPAW